MERNHYLQVEDNPKLLRDTVSKAIINTDTETLAKARVAKQNRLKDKERLTNLESDVLEIKDTLGQILALLKKD